MSESGKTVNVLLVDDEVDFLMGLARSLERRGFKVTTAKDVKSAVSILEKGHPIDVAVLDVRLPDGDGHDLFLDLKKRYPLLQAIILTGNRDENKSFSLSHKGLYAYLDKPCEVELLSKTILDAYDFGNIDIEEESISDMQDIPDSEKIRVLLIDDEEDYVKSLSRVLARRGVIVSKALSGEEGLQLIEKEDIDVAVIDLKMPGMNGLEVLHRIKKLKPEVEVILLTGHATVEAGIEGMKYGAADYLFKPQDPDALLRKIQYAASKSSANSKKRRWWRRWKN